MTDIIKDDAHKLLKQKIDSKGLKQKYVAEKIGISTNYLGQVLNGDTKMSAEVAIRASRALDLSLEFFLNKS